MQILLEAYISDDTIVSGKLFVNETSVLDIGGESENIQSGNYEIAAAYNPDSRILEITVNGKLVFNGGASYNPVFAKVFKSLEPFMPILKSAFGGK